MKLERTYAIFCYLLFVEFKAIYTQTECSLTASYTGRTAITMCPESKMVRTSTHIVVDSYHTFSTLGTISCECSFRFINARGVASLYFSPLSNLGVNYRGCGSEISVRSLYSGAALSMSCSGLGSLDQLLPSENFTMQMLKKSQSSDSRYCIAISATESSTNQPYEVEITCYPPPTAATTTTTSTTTSATTSTTTATTSTPEPTTSTTTTLKTTTTTMKSTTTTAATTVTKSIETTKISTPHPTTSTSSANEMTTFDHQTSTTPTGIVSTVSASTGQSTTQYTTIGDVHSKESDQTIGNMSSAATLGSTSPVPGMTVKPTVKGQKNSEEQRLIIIIPVVLGFFVLILIIVTIKTVCGMRKKPKETKMPVFKKIAIGKSRLGQPSVTFADEMYEHKNDDKDSILNRPFGQEKITRVDNPVFIHDENDQENTILPHFTNIEDETDSKPNQLNEEPSSTDPPIYAQVEEYSDDGNNDVNAIDFSSESSQGGSENNFNDSTSEDRILY